MKLNEINRRIGERGTYLAVKFTKETDEAIIEFAKKLKIKNILDVDKLHTTVIYSRKPAKGLKVDNEMYPITIIAERLQKFKTRLEEKVALVLVLNAPELVARHNQIMEEFNTTYDFEEYIPHITLSYDCGDCIEEYDGEYPEIAIEKEYMEDLNLNWQPENA